MSEEAASHVTTHDDGKFIRTAIIAQEQGTSFDIVNGRDERLCIINVFPYYNDANEVEHVIVDVIDVDENFPERFALTFNNGTREFHPAEGRVISADFRTS